VKNKVSAMIREAAEKNPNEWVYVENLRVGDTLVHPQPADQDSDDDSTLALMGEGEWNPNVPTLRDYCDCVREVRVVGITLMEVNHTIVTEYGSEQDWEGDALRIEVEPIRKWDDPCEGGETRNGFYWYVLPRYRGDERGQLLRVRGGRHL